MQSTLFPQSLLSALSKSMRSCELDLDRLGSRLMLLKKSGHVDIMKKDYPSSLTLPNAIAKVFLTELGRKTLKDRK